MSKGGKILVRYAAESGYCFNVNSRLYSIGIQYINIILKHWHSVTIGRNTWRTPYMIYIYIYTCDINNYIREIYSRSESCRLAPVKMTYRCGSKTF